MPITEVEDAAKFEELRRFAKTLFGSPRVGSGSESRVCRHCGDVQHDRTLTIFGPAGGIETLIKHISDGKGISASAWDELEASTRRRATEPQERAEFPMHLL
jgi:hypothetical protein